MPVMREGFLFDLADYSYNLQNSRITAPFCLVSLVLLLLYTYWLATGLAWPVVTLSQQQQQYYNNNYRRKI